MTNYRVPRLVYGWLFVLLFATGPPAWDLSLESAPAAEIPRTPEEHEKIDQALEELASKDRTVRSNAIGELGYWQREDVTDTLIHLLRRQLNDDQAWKGGILCTTAGAQRVYLEISPENLLLIETLARQQAVKAVPIVQEAHAMCLKHASEARRHATGRLASAIYSLSGKIVEIVQEDNSTSKFVPRPLQEERMRLLIRPDLHPVGGLTAKLDIPATSACSVPSRSESWSL